MLKISKIDSVDLSVIAGESPRLRVVASAKPFIADLIAELTGWQYLIEPADGIQDFDFNVRYESEGVPTHNLHTVVEASHTFDSNQMANVKGVRVHASSNTITVRRLIITQNDPATNDDVSVKNSSVDEAFGQLKLEVEYGGGLEGHLENHSFELQWSGQFLLSNPPQAAMRLVHNANGDTGERLIRETLIFDLLDLPPCNIKLITKTAVVTNISYKRTLHKYNEMLIPGHDVVEGNNTVPILTVPTARFLVHLLQDSDGGLVKAFNSDPALALKKAGLNEQEINQVMNLINPTFVQMLKGFGVREEILNGFTGILDVAGKKN
jgi:hypothetical protein